MIPDLSVIILNYNTRDYLRYCLASVFAFKSDKISIEVIVVDNASTDNSVYMVQEQFPQARLIINKINIGFAAGNNKALKTAKGRYLLLLNSDTKVYKETFGNMIDFMDQNQKVGLATCRVELPDGSLDWACHRGFPTPWRAFCYFSGLEKLFGCHLKIFGGYHLKWYNLSNTHEIDSPAGSFFFLRKKAIEQVGLLDESFFMYGEDLDYALRLKKAGWQVLFNPSTKIVHYKYRSGVKKGYRGNNQKEALAKRKKSREDFYSSMKIFYDKHYKDKYPFLIRQFVLLGIRTVSYIKQFKS